MVSLYMLAWKNQVCSCGYYNCRQYRPQKGGICVANHTSPIDVLILTTDGCYAMVRAAPCSSVVCVWCIVNQSTGCY